MMPEQRYIMSTIHEEFNEYVLDDGNILKLKDILLPLIPGEKTKVGRGKTREMLHGQINHIHALVPAGKTDVSLLEPIGDNSVSKEHRTKIVCFEPRHESLNIYTVSGHYIFVKTRLDGVWLTKFKDRKDLPVYSLCSNVALEIKPMANIAVFNTPAME